MWQQPFSGERVQYNGAQAYALRSLVLSIAGSVSGVLGLNNLTGFAFYGISVAAVNVAIALVLARGNLERYFVVSSPPVPDAVEALTPKSAARLRTPPSTSKRVFSNAKWILFQGAQANVLSFVLWWTFCLRLYSIFE